MSKLSGLRLVVFGFGVVAMFILTVTSSAQTVSTSGSGSFTNVGYSWQVDQGPGTSGFTTTFKGGVTYTLVTNQIANQTVGVSTTKATQLHEIHGNVSVTVPGSTTIGSIIIELIANNGNILSSSKLAVIGTGSQTVAVSGTFNTPISIPAGTNAFYWRWYVDNPGTQAVNMSLVMN